MLKLRLPRKDRHDTCSRLQGTSFLHDFEFAESVALHSAEIDLF
jgi:hypothetical protein